MQLAELASGGETEAFGHPEAQAATGSVKIQAVTTASSHSGPAGYVLASKVFMGPEHAKTSSLSCTPGPCYEVAGACGRGEE